MRRFERTDSFIDALHAFPSFLLMAVGLLVLLPIGLGHGPDGDFQQYRDIAGLLLTIGAGMGLALWLSAPYLLALPRLRRAVIVLLWGIPVSHALFTGYFIAMALRSAEA